ncbi:hypothetical protein R3P38DRAFT_2851162 [Favolaschia claudopus]|uniref:Uncharacterized protein n=1 Tax=Favolaschia claudopus TaxID=2862362 RepID=A0AAW0DQ38_9AGAR
MALPVTLAVNSTAHLRDVIIVLDNNGKFVPPPELLKTLTNYLREAMKLGKNIEQIYNDPKNGADDNSIIRKARDRKIAALIFLQDVRTSSQKAKQHALGRRVQTQFKLKSTKDPSFMNKTIYPMVDKLGTRRLRYEKAEESVLPDLCTRAGVELVELRVQVELMLATQLESEDAEDSADTYHDNPLENPLQPSIVHTEDAVTTAGFDDGTDSSDLASVVKSEIYEDQLSEAITEAVEDLRQSGAEEKTYEPSFTSDGGWSFLDNTSSISVAQTSTVTSNEAGTSTGYAYGLPFSLKFKLHRLPEAIFGGTGGQGGNGGRDGGGGGIGMAPQLSMGNTTAMNFNCQGPVYIQAEAVQTLR